MVGAIRVIDHQDASVKRIAPLFILKTYRNLGYAQQAIQQVELIHGKEHWQLDTILQETSNCYLYEKLGYRKTGQYDQHNFKMAVVYGRRHIGKTSLLNEYFRLLLIIS